MASDIKTSGEDAEMTECAEEKVVTMMDVLQEQEEFEEDANAVLGASDEKSCTYSKGYIKRQALYACLTCCPEAKLDSTKRAGVCLACSLLCHENHDLVELYTKRNFRCDCGNPNFNSQPCSFTPNKTDFNKDNIYNQNFSGLYCTCQRPYPDPESEIEVTMIQCIICEDWLHTSHLESTVPANDQYSEMICKSCMAKNYFLHDYFDLAVHGESADVDIVNGVDDNKTSVDDNKTSVDDNKTSVDDNETSVDDNKTSVDDNKTSVDDNKPIDDCLKTNITSNINEAKSDVEITKINLEGNVNFDNCIKEIPDVKINEENKKDATTTEENGSLNGSEKQEVNMSELMETDESVGEPTSAQKEVSNNIKPAPSNKSEEAIAEPDKTKDITDNSMVADIQENCNSSKTDIENINDQKDIGKSIEEQNVKADEKQNEDKEQKNTGEKQEQDAEKLEEERLLADPEDDKEKSVPVEVKDNIIEEHSETKVTENISDTITVPQIEVSKLESEQNSEDKIKICDEQSEKSDDIKEPSDEIKHDSDKEKKSEFTDVTTNEALTENTVEPESEVDKGVIQDTSSENCQVESNSPDKISEKRKHEEESSDNQPKKQKLEDKCIRPKGVKRIFTGATFWASNFRQKLCTCQECISMYKDLSVLFLTDPEDTVSAYENLGKEKFNGKPASQYERGVEALLSLDRNQQINALTEYNKMRDQLLDYLKSFKDKKEIVKEEHIRAFFAGMKPKRESDGVYFCR